MNARPAGPGFAATGRPDRLTVIAFALFVVIGGANGVAVRFSDFDLPPFWGAGLRLALTGLIFWAIVAAKRERLPSRRALIGALLYGFFGLGAFLGLIYWGLVKVPASTSAPLLALSPLFTLVFAAGHGLERFRWRGLAGALVALAGIVVGIGGQFGASAPIVPLLAVAIGVACSAEGAVLLKLAPKAGPFATNAIGSTTAAALLLALSLLTGESRHLPSTPTTWATLAYLVVAGSVLLFALYVFVLERWTASATSYSFLMFPVVGVSFAAWLGHETVTPLFVVGSAIVLLGVWIGALRQPASARGEEAARAVVPAPADRAVNPIEAQPWENC